MGSLGEFGVAIKRLDPDAPKDTVTYFGETFEIISPLPPILAFELAATMTGKYREIEGMSSMWEALYISFGVEEYKRFRRVAITELGDTGDLIELAMSIYQGDSGRPTERPVVSSDGPSTTSPSSSTSSTPPLDSRDLSVPHLVPVGEILAG